MTARLESPVAGVTSGSLGSPVAEGGVGGLRVAPHEFHGMCSSKEEGLSDTRKEEKSCETDKATIFTGPNTIGGGVRKPPAEVTPMLSQEEEWGSQEEWAGRHRGWQRLRGGRRATGLHAWGGSGARTQEITLLLSQLRSSRKLLSVDF